MIKTNNTPCTYEELYYEMWETAGRYSKITRFQVIGSSHDERLIPAVWVGNGNQTVFCIAGMIGTDRYMPGYLVEMIKEYTRAWECGWKLEEIYNLKDLFEKWTICFVPLLNPDGYEIYENDFFAIRNPDLSADAPYAGSLLQRIYRKCPWNRTQEKLSYRLLPEKADPPTACK